MRTYNSDELLRSLEVTPPEFDVGHAKMVARDSFGILADPTALGGERDKNFLLDAGQQKLLLKVANPSESDAILTMQNSALRHIERCDPSLPVPRLRKSHTGEDWVQALGNDAKTYRVRLLTYLPGRMFFEADHDARLFREMGATIARLDQALRGFFDASADHGLAWDLKHAHTLSYLADDLDLSIRGLVKDVFDRYVSNVVPALAGLRSQIIHNDVSYHNCVVSETAPIHVTGIYDFGDLIYAPLIQELAVSAAEIPLGRKDPIAVSAALVAGFHSVTPLEEQELALLPDMVAMRLALGVSIAHWKREKEFVEDTHGGVSFNPRDLLSQLADLKASGLERHYRAACGMRVSVDRPAQVHANNDALKHRRSQILGNAEHLSYDRPLHVVRGEGTWLFDAEARAYLDAYNNVPSVGHCHPRVVTAICEQAAKLNTNTRYLFESIVDYSERITATLPDGLDVCLFVSSGSEANDLAWRIAKACTGNQGGLVMERAYHGITDAVMDLSPYNVNCREKLPSHIETLPPPDDYRGAWKRDDPHRGDKFAQLVDGAIENLADKGHRPAAVMIDSILSSNGIMVPAPGYLAGVFDRVRAAGGLCIADEVQSGFGRLGSHLWGFETGNVVPDIVTFGKPIGNGHPLGLVVTTRELARKFSEQHEFFSTTAGNPVSCSAALAVLDVIEREYLRENALRIGTQLAQQVRELSSRHPLIGDVRGGGLFIGIELVINRDTLEPATAQTRLVVNKMRELGVLVGVEGEHSNVLKVRPPLVFGPPHVEQFIDTLSRALAATP